jgi:hypothetical protein
MTALSKAIDALEMIEKVLVEDTNALDHPCCGWGPVLAEVRAAIAEARMGKTAAKANAERIEAILTCGDQCVIAAIRQRLGILFKASYANALGRQLGMDDIRQQQTRELARKIVEVFE